MEFTPITPPEAQSFWRRPGPLAAIAALALYALLISRFILVCAGGSDSSGYLNHARLLATGHVHAPERVIETLSAAQTPPYLYTPLGFKPAPNGHGLVPTYAAGFPLLVLAAAQGVGWAHAGDVVILLHALLGVVLTYLLGRAAGLSRPGAVLGAAIIGASPLYLQYSLQAMSDLPALVWVALTVLLALVAGKPERRILWAVAAGIALSMAVLIRPNNILVLPAVLVALGWSPRRWLAVALGGVPGAIFFCLHAKAAYGKFLTTGYGDSWSAFSSSLVPGTLLHYLHWLPALFTPVVLLALGLPWVKGAAPRAAATLGTWALVFLAFYSAYYNTHETWWYLRFVLPAAPALVIGGLLVARRIPAAIRDPLIYALVVVGAYYAAYHYIPQATRHFRFVLPLLLVLSLIIARHVALKIKGPAWTVFAAALALAVGNGAWWSRRFDVLDTSQAEQTYPRAMAWLNGHLPANAVVVAMQTTGAAYYYTHFILLRWDEISPRTFPPIVAAARAAHRPIYAALYSFESAEALQQHVPGSWSKEGTVADVTFWRLNGE